MTQHSIRQGNLLTLLLVALTAIAIGLALAWLKFYTTFQGVEESFLIYQSRSLIERRWDDGNEELAAERLTEFPLAEVVNGKTFDFGVAEPGKLLQHTFELKNSGNAPLEVMLEGVTCKCLTMGLEKNKVVEVQPGDTLDIKLEWRSDSLTKNFKQYARIKTNDPENRRAQIELMVTGRIVSPVLASPERVSSELKSSAEQATFEFRVHAFESESIDPESFDIQGITFDRTSLESYLDFQWDRLSAEEVAKEPGAVAGYLVTGKVLPGAPKGVYIGKLSVETSSGHPVGLDMAVRVQAPIVIRPLKTKGNINYYPESQLIEFGIVEANEEAELRMLMMYNIDDPDLEITLPDEVAQPAGYVKAEIETVTRTAAGKMAKIRVWIPKDCPRAQFQGPTDDKMLKLTVKSNSKFAPEVVFPVSFAKQ